MKGLVTLFAIALFGTFANAQRWMHLTLESPPGEWIGGGENWDVMYTDANTVPGQFSAQLAVWGEGSLPDTLQIAAMQEPISTNYLLAFFGTNQLGHELRPGVYLDAERAPFASPGHPGLDVSFQHRGSNTLAGSFEILSIQYHAEGSDWVLDSFHASFTQISDGGPLALTGTLEYSAVPEPGVICALGLGLAGFWKSRRKGHS